MPVDVYNRKCRRTGFVERLHNLFHRIVYSELCSRLCHYLLYGELLIQFRTEDDVPQLSYVNLSEQASRIVAHRNLIITASAHHVNCL